MLIVLVSGLSFEILFDFDSILSVYKDKEEIFGWVREKIAVIIVVGLVVSYLDVKILNLNKFVICVEVVVIFY